jgi:bifunctional non-homologous end joining protein LigD
MRLRLVKEPFDNPDYIFELKHDGFRAVVYLQNGECKLISRNLKNLRFESLKLALAKLAVKNAIIDGEICCLDERGVSQFNQLLNRKAEPVLYALDLLWLDDEDLRRSPLVERKSRLAVLVQANNCERILYAQHVEGKELWRNAGWGFIKTTATHGSRSKTVRTRRPREGTSYFL